MMSPRKWRIASVTPDAWGKGIHIIMESVDGKLFDKTKRVPKCSSGESHKLGEKKK